MIVRAEKVRKEYIRERSDSNIFEAVRETSLQLKEKEFVALFGRSGSGKSTLLNMVAGLLSPTEGQIFYDDVDISTLKDAELSRFRNEHIGVIPQGQTAISSLTVMENVLLPYHLYGRTKNPDEKAADVEKRAAEILDETGISDLKDVMPSELSGGELRRMAIARALVQDPDVILADEPTADLDEENTRDVLRLLKNIAEKGKVVFVVTHDNEVIRFASTIYDMSNGVIEKRG